MMDYNVQFDKLRDWFHSLAEVTADADMLNDEPLEFLFKAGETTLLIMRLGTTMARYELWRKPAAAVEGNITLEPYHMFGHLEYVLRQHGVAWPLPADLK